jgi:hypothetical protein
MHFEDIYFVFELYSMFLAGTKTEQGGTEYTSVSRMNDFDGTCSVPIFGTLCVPG